MSLPKTAPQNGLPYDKYQWHKNAENLWQRDVDEAERFYASICRQTDDPEAAAFAITGSASFSVDISDSSDPASAISRIEESLQTGWKAVRSQCPAVASWIAHDKETESWKRLCLSFDEDANPGVGVSKWLSDTFHIVQTDKGEGEWFNTDPPVYKLPTIFLVGPGIESTPMGTYRATVCFRSPHDVIDGHGILKLLDILFEAAADAYNGMSTGTRSISEPPTSLSVPFRVACNVAPSPSEAQIQYFKDTFTRNASIATELPPLGLPTNQPPCASSERKRVATSLPENLSTDLRRECKHKGFTITHAISAGVVLALKRFQPQQMESRKLRWYMQGLLSLRYLCEPQYSTAQHASGNIHVIATQGLGLDVEVPAKDDKSSSTSDSGFTELATKIRDYYVGVRPPKDLSNRNELDVAPVTWKALTPAVNAQQPEHSAAGVQAPASVAVSSLGNIASMIKEERKPFTLTNVWVAGEGQGSATPLMLGGWGGKIEVSAIFDSAFCSEDYMREFQQAVLDATIQGLRVSRE